MPDLVSQINAKRNMDSAPTISVLMPVYNGGKYLAEAVESILDQTYRDFEFIVMDDGSTDDTLKQLQQYAAKDSRLRVIAKEHRGLGPTQRELVEFAGGEFIAHMDADDIALPCRFEQQIAFLKKNPKVVALGGAYQVIDNAGRYLTTLTQPQTDTEIQQLMLSGHTAMSHPAVMMRLEAIHQVGGYDSEYDLAEDLDLFLRLGEVGELANLTDVLLKYRLHDKSISENAAQEIREPTRKTCERAWKRRNIAGEFTANSLWRPGPDRASQHAFMLQYGWWAWNSRQRKTAAFYGWQAVKVKPFAIAGWKLLVVALFKPLVNAATS